MFFPFLHSPISLCPRVQAVAVFFPEFSPYPTGKLNLDVCIKVHTSTAHLETLHAFIHQLFLLKHPLLWVATWKYTLYGDNIAAGLWVCTALCFEKLHSFVYLSLEIVEECTRRRTAHHLSVLCCVLHCMLEQYSIIFLTASIPFVLLMDVFLKWPRFNCGEKIDGLLSQGLCALSPWQI